MTDSRRSARAIAAGLGLATVISVGLTSAGAAAQIRSTPHIRARPHSVMVNGTMMLTGTGFPRNSIVRVEECGRPVWIVPEEPCDTTNAVTVTSDASGRFTTPFTVQLCPRELPPKPPVNRERCYIGQPLLTGEDTMGLAGAAKITVTYP